MSEAGDKPTLAAQATELVRNALTTLSFASDGFYEDEADRALDALDWLEHELGLDLLPAPPAPPEA